MRFAPFSKKQLRVLTWWRPGSPDRQKDAILCDGAVRPVSYTHLRAHET